MTIINITRLTSFYTIINHHLIMIKIFFFYIPKKKTFEIGTKILNNNSQKVTYHLSKIVFYFYKKAFIIKYD